MKRVLVAVIVTGLAVLAAWLLVTGGTEAGDVSRSQGATASASFYTEDGATATYVDLYASDYVDQVPPGKPHKDSSASICIYRYNWETGEPLLEACGYTSLPESAFQIDKGLNNASLDAVINVCSGVPPTPPPTPSLTPPPTVTAMAAQNSQTTPVATPPPTVTTPTPIPPECCAPALPTTFTGTVTVDGQPAPDGTTISAIDSDGQTWAMTTTCGGGYAINVPQSPPVTAPCFPGGTISFQCDGASAAETGEATGGLQELNLTCGPLVPLTPVPPTPEPPTCFDVDIDMTWVGSGPLSRQNSHSHYHSPEFKENWHCNGTWRAATATGIVSDGGTNFTPDPSVWAEMSAGNCGGVTAY
jgi:hypothetical protein